MLDFGAGPVIAYMISASLYASEIVLSEYVDKNREVLQMWLDRDPNAPNWSPFSSMLFKSWKERAKKRLQREKRSCARLSKQSSLVISIKIPQLNQPTVAHRMLYLQVFA